MSQDRKPGKVRVVGTATPDRRRTDPVTITVEPAAVSIDAPAAEASGGKGTLLLSALFVAGCAAGGAGMTALGIF